ncbi:hypothetical protein ACI77O_12580 [Pseudomonas tritici]|uniref:hypothetical protein n=1 Tax=Pseudomonas tritici TaxID=2745518 RepID=UPI00387B31A7
MTDAYIFEVHTDSDVQEKNGKLYVQAKYAFDWIAMAFTPNTDKGLMRQVTSRHKDGRVLAYIERFTNKQYCQTKVPSDCYEEKSC